MTIESIGKLLLGQLENSEWEAVVEDDYPDFKHFQAFVEVQLYSPPRDQFYSPLFQ